MNKRTPQPPAQQPAPPAATTAPAAAGLPPDSRTMNTRQLRQAVVAYCVGQQRSMEQILQHLVRQPEQADRVRVAVYDMVRLGKMVNLSIIDGVRICKQGAYLAHDANLDAMAAHRLDFAPLVSAWLGPWHVQRLAGGGAAA